MAVAMGCYSSPLACNKTGGKGRDVNNSSSSMSAVRQRWLSLYKVPDIWKRVTQFREPPTPSSAVVTIPKPKQPDEQIGSVIADEVEPEVTWGQRIKDVKAERRRGAWLNPGFSFSAGGLLFPYHLGVCKCLLEREYITEDTPLAGASAGALVCGVICTGLSMQDALLATKALAQDCRTHGTAFRLGKVLRKTLNNIVPEDAHLKASGRMRVAITQLFRMPRALLVDEFESKEDLINALLTSCFIPGYLAPRPVTIFKNRICIDGGFTLFMPPTAAETTVRVCAFSAKGLGLQEVVAISPDCNPHLHKASTKQLFNWALEPAGDEILDELFELGYKDALVWTDANPLVNFRGQAKEQFKAN